MSTARFPGGSSRVRVMHVVEAFCGGVFSSVRQIVNALPPEQFETWLVYSRRPETPADCERQIAPGVRSICLPMRREVSPCADWRAGRQLLALMRAHAPHVVHCHSSKAGILGRWAARRARVPRVFYSPRGFAFLRGDVSRLARTAYFAAEWAGAATAGRIVACSASEYTEARQLTRRVELVNNSLDLAALDEIPLPPIALRVGAPLRVATCGRICPQKAPRLFAQLARTARNGSSQVQFAWIGDGDETAAQELRASGVEITGWLGRAAAVAELARADIYLHTSLWEGLPLAVLEAMALRKPVVATNVVGNRDAVLHGVTGYLAATADDLHAALQMLSRDQGLRQRMGRAGRRRVEEEFTLQRMMEGWQALYAGHPKGQAGASNGRP